MRAVLYEDELGGVETATLATLHLLLLSLMLHPPARKSLQVAGRLRPPLCLLYPALFEVLQR